METSFRAVQILYITLVVISYPDTRRVVRSHSFEPHIPVVRSRAGLSGRRHALDLSCRTGSSGSRDHVFHTVDQEPRVLFRDHLCGLRFIVQDHIAVVVHYLRVHPGLDILSAVGNRSVCRRQLQVGNAVRQAAQRKRLGIIVVRAFQFQRGKSKPEQIVDGHCRRHIRDGLDRHHVDRPGDRFPDRGPSAVIAADVSDQTSDLPVFRIGERAVVLHRARAVSQFLKCRRVRRQNFEGGARLAQGIRSPVQGTAGVLFAAASDHRHHVARTLFHDHHGSLGLDRHLTAFIYGIVLGDPQRRHIFVDRRLGGFFIVKQQVKIFIRLLEI